MRPYVEAAFRHRLLVLTPVVLIPLAALLFGIAQARQAESTAVVWVEEPAAVLPTDAPSGGSSEALLNEREAQALRERLETEGFVLTVLERAGLLDDIQRQEWPRTSWLGSLLSGSPPTRPLTRLLGNAAPQGADGHQAAAIAYVQDHLTVSASGEHLLKVQYTGGEPDLGALLVRTTIDAYNREVIRTEEAQSRAVLDPLQQQAASRQAELTEASNQLQLFEAEHPLPADGVREGALAQQQADLKARYDLALSLYQAAAEELEQARLRAESIANLRTASFRLVDPPAAQSGTRIDPNLLAQLVLLGAALGLALGTGAVALIVWTDRTIRRSEDVAGALGVPLLTALPHIRTAVAGFRSPAAAAR